MASLLNMSGGSLLNKGLPYDAKIEYLMSDGNAYINTGIYGKCNFEIQAGIQRAGSDISSIFGSRSGYHNNSFLIFWGQEGRGNEEAGVIRMNYGNKTFLFPSRSKNDVVLTYNGTTLSDGTQTLAISGNGTLTPFNSHFLFAVNSNGSMIGALSGTYIRYAKIGNLDLIPVRVGQTGYMYDKVSGQLFGNAGTGNFVLGPDVDEVGVPYVDFGLPSGTLWAKGNICKDSQGNYYIGDETEHGCYFAWGETEGYNDAAERNAALGRDDGFSGDSYVGDAATDNPTLLPEHDVASIRLGSGWHIPTVDEFTELTNNTDMVDANGNVLSGPFLTTIDGVKGALLKSKINGNCIFFPVLGCYNGVTLTNPTNGYYWMSTINNIYGDIKGMKFGKWTYITYSFFPYPYGIPIRPVK